MHQRAATDTRTGPEERERVAYGGLQAALLRTLVADAPLPEGFAPTRVRALADALERKRLRGAAKAWPGLASSLGERFAELFADYTRHCLPPADADPVADGIAFATWVRTATLDDRARQELLLVRARYVTGSGRARLRRGPAVAATRSLSGRGVLLVVGFPDVGVKTFALHLRPPTSRGPKVWNRSPGVASPPPRRVSRFRL